jgi:hypothetical protein
VGKVRQIFIWNGQQDLGPFRREELVKQLKAGAVLPSHYYFEQGMTGWERVARLPCCQKFLATDPQKQMLDRMGIKYNEFLTKDNVSSILENQPATDRQLALLKYLGLGTPVGLTKTDASEIIEKARSDQSLGERFERWTVDRLDLRPDLDAFERAAFKSRRAADLLSEYEQFRRESRENGLNFPKLKLLDVEDFVSKLDDAKPGWDRDIRMALFDHLLPAIERTQR